MVGVESASLKSLTIAKYSFSDWLEKMPDELLNMRNENHVDIRNCIKNNMGFRVI